MARVLPNIAKMHQMIFMLPSFCGQQCTRSSCCQCHVCCGIPDVTPCSSDYVNVKQWPPLLLKMVGAERKRAVLPDVVVGCHAPQDSCLHFTLYTSAAGPHQTGTAVTINRGCRVYLVLSPADISIPPPIHTVDSRLVLETHRLLQRVDTLIEIGWFVHRLQQ